MSSFFTLPSSQRKRKRSQPQDSAKKPTRSNDKNENDSISGSDISDDDVPVRDREDVDSEEDDEEDENEDPASKRIRLAEQYLANTQKEVLEDGAFDAAEVDKENLRRRTGERLKEDTAESKGKLHRWIADGLDWRAAKSQVLRAKTIQKGVTGVAMQGNHVYAVGKDHLLVKWQQPETQSEEKGKRASRKWKCVIDTRGSKKDRSGKRKNMPILCVAASEDGKFVATGGADKELIVWDATTLKPLKVFTQHRDAVQALAFRRKSNQLFSASKDRTVKIWSLDQLAYVETLFGHQDEVVDVSALGQEMCVTVGARDRTARLWKVVEESQLVFRGGGAGTSKALESLRKAYEDDSGVDKPRDAFHHEGCIDRVAMIDDDTFVTGSDNGSISLWNIHKKKAVFTQPLAHGLQPPIPLEEASAEQNPDASLDDMSRGGKHPRWITALAVIPFSDVIISGSWDGYIRAWKISQDKRRIEPVGAIGAVGESVDSLLEREGLDAGSVSKDAFEAMQNGANGHRRIQGIVNDLAVVEKGDRGKESVWIAAAVGKEHRLGRWKEVPGGKNQVILFEVAKKAIDSVNGDEDDREANDDKMEDGEDFEGFD